MKRWQIVYALPLEVWVDIFSFPWISRQKFGQIVDKIGNHKFAEHAQFYLHEWGKQKLSQFILFTEGGLFKYVQSGVYKLVHDEHSPHIHLDVPQTPLPQNVKSFAHITISHFDAKTMAFLGRIGSLLTVVQMHNVSEDFLDNLRTALTTMAPLLDTIHALSCNEHTLPVARHCLGEKFNMAKKLLYVPTRDEEEAVVQANVNTIMDWLTQPAVEGPRILYGFKDSPFSVQIIQAVRQQFLAAKTPPCTFALNLRAFDALEFHLENGIGEQLHGERIEHGDFQIVRHPAGQNTQEVWEWIWAMCAKRCGRILVSQPTIGSLNAAQVDEEQQAEQQQRPSCSAKKSLNIPALFLRSLILFRHIHI